MPGERIIKTSLYVEDTALQRAEKILRHAFANLNMRPEMRALWTLETAKVIEAYMRLDRERTGEQSE